MVNFKSMFESRILLVLRTNYQKLKLQGNLSQALPLHGLLIWNVMQRNAWKDIAKLANKTTEQLYKVATPCMYDHQFKEEENVQRYPLPDLVSWYLAVVSFHSCCFFSDFSCALDHSSNAFALSQVLFCHHENHCPCFMVAERD